MSSTAPPTRFRRALVIGNPIAGAGRGERLATEMADALTRSGIDAELHLTRARGDAAERTARRDPRVDLVVSVGGDGTLREVLRGLDDDTLPVAILPLGTANVLALDLGLARNVAGALRTIEGGRTTALDVAEVNGTLSFLVTGIGLDAAAVAEVERVRRGPISKSTYAWAMLRALRNYREPQLTVELDGARVAGPVGAVLIANIVHYGGVFHLDAQRVLDDGLFEVYLFRRASIAAMAAAATRAFIANLPGGSCEMQRAARVRVVAPEPVPYHVDGDFGGTTPLDFAVSPRRRRILIP